VDGIHEVTVTRDFLLGQTEVANAAFVPTFDTI
jgi:hypothetical protein